MFNIDINDIPLEDWNKLIYKNYCKNTIDNKLCLRKIKKLYLDNKDICSKCCEKKGLKKYKRKSRKLQKKNTQKINNEDSGFYTETDNEIDKVTLIKENTNEKPKPNTSIFNDIKKDQKCIYFGDLEIKTDNYRILNLCYPEKKQENIINKHINNHINRYDGYIMFGSLEVEIQKDKNKDISLEGISSNENKICNRELRNKIRKRILTKIKIIKYFNRLYLKIKNKKENNLIDNINEDIYYVFLYSISLIFKFKDINFIRKEIHNCLGYLGISFYIKQFNNFI